MAGVIPINVHRLPSGVTLEEIDATAASMTDEEIRQLLYCWPLWSRPEQEWPDGEWSKWLIMAGRGYGKTRTGAETVRDVASRAPRQRIALVGPTAADCRDVMVEGESGLLEVFPAEERPVYEPSKRRVTFRNGTIAILYSAEEPERLRGPQHHFAWCDEIAVYPKPDELFSNLTFGLRLGNDPRCLCTTTPKPLKWLKAMLADANTVATRGSTYDNRANLPAATLAEFERIYAGTRIGRQELGGELMEEAEGALWRRAQIDALRVRQAPELVRIVVAIDPSTTSGANSDECGIIGAGLGRDGHGYALADRTRKVPPDQWIKAAVDLFDELSADRIIAETNNGGDLVEALLRTCRANAPYTKVTASRGKVARAEPVAALYEQGKIHHVGGLAALEDEMVNFVPGNLKDSPNRADALVWAFSHLMLKPVREGRVIGL